MPGIGGDHFPFSLADQQPLVAKQIEKCIPADVQSLLLKSGQDHLQELSGPYPAHEFSFIANHLQNDLFIKGLMMVVLAILVIGLPAVAKQSTQFLHALLGMIVF